MNRLDQAIQLAQSQLGRSVVRVNASARLESLAKAPDYLTFGVKNSADIPSELIDRLRADPHFLFLTIDKMSDLGRSVDIDLINPLTYRCMTGSTSGGCINILKGINALCIGTDGGGSVLAPALATNLYSFLGKGLGLALVKQSRSTDSIPFTGGIGLIASTFQTLTRGMEALTGLPLYPDAPPGRTLRVAVPAKGSVRLPDGEDCRAILDALAGEIPGVEWVDVSYRDFYSRAAVVEDLNVLFGQEKAELVLSLEGPVDVYGYDETIPRAFAGAAAGAVTNPPSKGLVKAANIAGCTAYTVPCARLASGFVVVTPAGESAARNGLWLAARLAEKNETPEVFRRYFIDCAKYVVPSVYE